MTLTASQLRALEWLPSDGAWRISPGRLHAALASLRQYHRNSMEMEVGPFGSRGGWVWRYRLTPTGIALKAQMEQDK